MLLKINKFWIEFEIDEFIDGVLYHCDSYIKNKKILFTQVCECSRPCYDFLQGKNKGTIVLKNNHSLSLKLKNYTEQILKYIGLPKGGITHSEVFIEKLTGKFYFLEVAHRSPGVLIPEMYKKYLNVGTIEPHILLQIDEDYLPAIKYGPFSAWMAFPTKQGYVSQFFEPEIKSEYLIYRHVKKDDYLYSPKMGRDYALTILLWNKDYEQLKKDFKYLNDFIAYSVIER